MLKAEGGKVGVDSRWYWWHLGEPRALGTTVSLDQGNKPLRQPATYYLNSLLVAQPMVYDMIMCTTHCIALQLGRMDFCVLLFIY